MNDSEVKWYENIMIELNDTIELQREEIKRLRESIKAYIDLDMDSLEFCRIMREMGVIE